MTNEAYEKMQDDVSKAIDDFAEAKQAEAFTHPSKLAENDKPEAYILTASEVSIIQSCLLALKRMLDWAAEVVEWAEEHTDIPSDDFELGTTDWVSHMRDNCLPSYERWIECATKDVVAKPHSPDSIAPAANTAQDAKPLPYLIDMVAVPAGEDKDTFHDN